MQKMTINPDTDRKRVACVIFGTDLGDRNNGAATDHVNGSRLPVCLDERTYR